MSNEEKIVEKLDDIAKLLASNQSDYCESDEACRIIGVNNTRYLTQLHTKGHLPRYQRGEGFKYKKSDCYKVAALLDSEKIVLQSIVKRK